MRIFYLVGIKHSGKSNLGSFATSVLQNRYSVNFVDTDDLVQASMPIAGMSIRDFYRTEGEEAFRSLEYASLKSFLKSNKDDSHGILLIATGGGASDNTPLIEFMQASGTIIYLSVSEPILFERIMERGIPPFISSKDPEGSFHRLYTQRDGRYRQISNFMVRLYDYQSVQENGKLLANFIQELIGSEESCQEIPLELH